MWGQTLVEASLQQNFNFGFSTYKSDILLHLSQWQYWWWFWFSLVWVAYYYIIVYCTTRRTFMFNPVMNTSLRGHGKWGDFLVALIPLSWCGNILINSNFILRMIEWQNENTLFTVRIQGKQWYWVYKYDATSAASILSTPRNVGHNKWAMLTPNEVLISDSYYQAINLGSQFEFLDEYKSLLDKNKNMQPNLPDSSLISNKILHTNTTAGNFRPTLAPIFNFDVFIKLTEQSASRFNFQFKTKFFDAKTITFELEDLEYTDESLGLNTQDVQEEVFSYFNVAHPRTAQMSTHYDYVRVDDTDDAKGNLRPYFAAQPLRFIKTPLNLAILENLSNKDNDFLITTQWNLNSDAVQEKVYQDENTWKYTQKKYKRLTKVKFNPRIVYDPRTFEPIGVADKTLPQIARSFTNKQVESAVKTSAELLSDKPLIKVYRAQNLINPESAEEVALRNQSVTQKNPTTAPIDFYKSIKRSRVKGEKFSVTLARRLLRVRRVLFLPAYTNITFITNSYDVVHSWFIPGLGLKLDCVPGRSTHHTFYVDNVGLFYGQCAEICGRYHHHMPIRMCAVTFDFFLVWWFKKGLVEFSKVNKYGDWENSKDRYFNYHNYKVVNSTNQSYNSRHTPMYKYEW